MTQLKLRSAQHQPYVPQPTRTHGARWKLLYSRLRFTTGRGYSWKSAQGREAQGRIQARSAHGASRCPLSVELRTALTHPGNRGWQQSVSTREAHPSLESRRWGALHHMGMTDGPCGWSVSSPSGVELTPQDPALRCWRGSRPSPNSYSYCLADSGPPGRGVPIRQDSPRARRSTPRSKGQTWLWAGNYCTNPHPHLLIGLCSREPGPSRLRRLAWHRTCHQAVARPVILSIMVTTEAHTVDMGTQITTVTPALDFPLIKHGRTCNCDRH